MEIRQIMFFWACLLGPVGFLAGQNPKPLCILLSKSYGNGAYERWVRQGETDVRLVSLYHVRKDSLEFWLDEADGVLLTGGEDIYPARYGQEADTGLCGDFDLFRDSLEFALVSRCFERQLPVFGICRGFQLLNVYFGGSLHPDIPTALGEKVNHRKDGPVEHPVQVIPVKGSPAPLPPGSYSIQSNHHQGISKSGDHLVPFCRSEDGLIEGFFGEPGGTVLPFLLAVQWHPERMDFQSPMSGPLARAFVSACRVKNKKSR